MPGRDNRERKTSPPRPNGAGEDDDLLGRFGPFSGAYHYLPAKMGRNRPEFDERLRVPVSWPTI